MTGAIWIFAIFAETGFAVPDCVSEACGAESPPMRLGVDEQPPSPSAKSEAQNVDPIVVRSFRRTRVRAEHKVVT
jgi:hypothetical protein